MDSVCDPDIHTIVVMKSAQVGWTEILGNVVGYYIDQDPCPLLLIQPTLEMAQAWSKDRLAPMLRDTPALSGKVKDARSRDSGNTMLHKTFSGGHLTMAGANSPASLASRPIRIVLFDEVDRFPASAGSEGDPISLASKRTTTFWNRKKLIGSTPTVKGASRIEAAFEGSDMRHYYVPCPHCDEMQKLKWGGSESSFGVKWPDGRPEEAYYVCEHCAAVINDTDKLDMLTKGKWIAEGESNGIAGFHINEVYSPWVTFGEMATNFIEAKKLPETLKTWVNTALGETWEEEGDILEPNSLFARREHYSAEVPQAAVLLTCGVDVQDDRLEAEVFAWAKGEECWTVGVGIFYGDPGRAELWKRLDDYINRSFSHESGINLKVAATCVDSGGHYSQEVYKFCKERSISRVYAIRGKSVAGSPIVGKPSTSNLGKVQLFPLGVDTAKQLIYGRLRVNTPGPGYCHFPVTDWCDEEYFAQLTAEKCVTRFHKGFPKREWIKIRPRNEAIDRRVYGYAAMMIINPSWDALSHRLDEVAEAKSKNEAPPVRKRRRMLSKGVQL